MYAFPITLRLLIVTGLLAGLGTAGLSPCLLAAASCDSATPGPAAKVCCCKGKCGQRCRMACCRTPAPTQDRTPAPPKLADEFAPIWGLANAATHVDAATAAEFRYGNSRDSASASASATLLALSIRLNV